MADFFRRVEKKYILDKNQYKILKEIVSNKMIEDEHGKSVICNIYYDTANYDLIRHSIGKPIYKDKVRLRSYNVPNVDSTVYLEIKKKFKGIVSKRRIPLILEDYYHNIKKELDNNRQVFDELEYYFKFYQLKPKVFLSYFRRAFYSKEDRGFRITFDSNVIARDYDLRLELGIYGQNILEKDKYIMEIKTLGAMPLWFVKELDNLKLCPCGFSKYGEAYTQLILKANKVKEYII